MQTIKYHLEWADCFPFWTEEGDNIPTEVLDLSTSLQEEVDDLNNYYQSLYVESDPQESGFPNAETAKKFAARMVASAEALQIELSGRYKVVFKDTYWQALLRKM